MASSAAGSVDVTNGGAVKRQHPPGQVTRVAIRDGKTISINDYVYVTTPWAPGAGEPYLIARVMEFVSTPSRSSSKGITNTSGTLQVRANYFLRMRDISHRISSDSRLLVATMHSDILALDNVRGLCEVRHRDLIGEAPAVGAWKKKDDHFYYHQFFDRYIHRFYDVVPTFKVQNAPADVLSLLRRRYSFIVAEPGVSGDLCDALRGCVICHQWASGPESVRCDVCKKYFHMRCVTPPLTSKPAKGYGWTCAPCYRRHEQTVALESGGLPASGSSSSSSPQISTLVSPMNADKAGLPTDASSPLPMLPAQATQLLKARLGTSGSRGGRPKTGSARRTGVDGDASSANTPEGSPAPERTLDDIRGVRCTNGWNYRYFGQHTEALDVLDPHDSIYPRATTRIGSKYQSDLPTWEEQQEMGLGVAMRPMETGNDTSNSASGINGDVAASAGATASAFVKKSKGGRPRKNVARQANGRSTPLAATTPILAATNALLEPGLSSERESSTPAPISDVSPSIREFERGSTESVDIICNLCHLYEKKDSGSTSKINLFEPYMASAAFHFKPLPPYNVDFINRAVQVYCDPNLDPIAALSKVSTSDAGDFRIVHWTQKERKAFDTAVREFGLEMRQIKRLIPTKKPAEIVRYYAAWKNERLKEAHEAEKLAVEQAKGKGKVPTDADADASASSQQSSLSTRAVSPALSLFDEKALKEASSNLTCKMCSVHDSSYWYKGPYAWPNRFLCSYCGLYWRKYAAEAVQTDLVATNSRKQPSSAEAPAGLGVAPPVKVAKLRQGDGVRGSSGFSSAPATSTASSPMAKPVAIAKLDPIRCVMCKRLEPKKKLQQCRQCSLSVHQDCFGLTDAEVAAEVWTCDPCSNEKTLDAILVPTCVLCPLSDGSMSTAAGRARAAAAATATAGGGTANVGTAATNGASTTALAVASGPAEPLNALDAFKPTECNNWAHLICAAWIPEIVFTDAEKMKLVEGAGHLPLWRYNSTCEICKMGGSTGASVLATSSRGHGACVQCSDVGCRRTFHVSCAFQTSNYSLGFEINPVKISRRDAVSIATFKAETGHWTTLAYCKSHRETFLDKTTYDFSEIDPKTGKTALQTYIRSHKSIISGDASVPPASGESNSNHASTASLSAGTTPSSISSSDQTYGLLRRAKRFDMVLNEMSTWTAETRKEAARASIFSLSPSPAVSNQHPNQPLPVTPGSAMPKVITAAVSPPATAARSSDRLGSGGNNGITSNGAGAGIDLVLKRDSAGLDSVRKPRTKECLACGRRHSPFWWDLTEGQQVGEQRVFTALDRSMGENPEARVHSASAGDVVCNQCRGTVLA